MEIKTYDTILNELCNNFDSLIAPRSIARTNTNIIYLLLKAFAKGLEVVNNTVVSLSHKFDPVTCTDEDLESVAKLVGTRKLAGSATGLLLIFKNITGAEDATLKAGTYTYTLDEDSIFELKLAKDVVIKSELPYKDIAISKELRAIPVTKQSNIELTGINALGEVISLNDFSVSCDDNKGLLGTEPETNIAFRERIVGGYTTASLFDRLREEIANLPYIFDCQLVFNNSSSPLTIDTLDTGEAVIVPAYHLLVMLSGNPDDKVAEIIASYGIYETATIATQEANIINYNNNVFVDGKYKVHYMKPVPYSYGLTIQYEADAKVISVSDIKSKILLSLEKFRNTNVYTPLLTERDFANFLTDLDLPSVDILNVDLIDKDKQVQPFIKIPKTRLAQLDIDQVTIKSITEE